MKKPRSYHLQLFIPIVGILLLLIIGFSIILMQREKSFRDEYLRGRIDIINQRILDLYVSEHNPTKYMKFVDEYFDETVLESLSMSVYDIRTGELLDYVGFPAPRPEVLPDSGINEGQIKGSFINNNNNSPISIDPSLEYFYNIDISSDGRYLVQTFLPNDDEILKDVADIQWWWGVVAVCCIVVTILTWFTTKHFSNNIKLLRDFAENASTDKDFIAINDFSNDDLGNISRQIVDIYNSRSAAIANKELEHKKVVKTIKERNLMQRQLTNNVNHELKTPATIIKGYLDTIASNPDMDEESRLYFLSKAQVQVDRLCSILNDLSMMTRLDESAHKINVERIEFKKFVSDLKTEIEESGICDNMKFVNHIHEECYIKGSVSILHSALMNLVKNAAAYSHGTEMGIKPLSNTRKYYTFIFYDNGIGVDEEHIPLLFERFYRIDKGRSRKSGGTGLGLPIVRSSISAMGGTVSVRNASSDPEAPDNATGLEFLITIPTSVDSD